MKRKVLLIGLLALIALPAVGAAQPPGGPPPGGPPPGGPRPEGPRMGGPRPEGESADLAHRDRARTFLVLRITDALKLNDADALKVSGVIRQTDEHRQELIRQRQALEDKLRTALARQPTDSAELGKLISEGNDLDQKIALVPEDSFRALQKVLTVEQQAKLLLFRRELQGEIRHAMQGRRLGGGRRGWQGRGGRGGPAPGDE